MHRYRPLAFLVALAALILVLVLLVRPRGSDTPPAPVAPPAAAVQTTAEAPPGPAAVPGERSGLDGAGQGGVPADAILLEVLSPEGEAFPGAAVTLVRLEPFHELGLTREAVIRSGLTTGGTGSRLFPDLVPGVQYRAAATAPGFSLERSSALEPGQRTVLRLRPSLVVAGVVERDGGGAVAEAEVQLLALQTTDFLAPQIATTGADGRFLFEVSEKGLYRLQVSSSAGSDVVRDFEVGPDLEPLRILVGGDPSLTLVLRDDSGQPVAGALVELQPMARGRKVRRGRSDEEGKARFFSLEGGFWTLRVQAEGLAGLQERWLYRPPGQERLERTLGRPGSLSVLVRDAAGRIVPGYGVQLQSAVRGAPPLPLAQTGEDGRVRWDDLAAGDYLVLGPGAGRGAADGSAEEQAAQGGAGRLPSTVWANVAAGSVAEAELVLDGHARLTVVVLQNGQPVEGVRVDLVRGARGIGGRRQPAVTSARSDAGGRALLQPVPPGAWRIVATPGANRVPYEVAVNLEAGTPEETVELPAGILDGRVLGPEGPISGALIRLLGDPPGQTGPGVRSGTDGRWEIGGIAPGRWRVEVRAPGHLPWTSEVFEHDGLGRHDLGALELAPAGILEGTVRGLPPPEAGTLTIRMAELLDGQGQTVAHSAIDADGYYRFPEVAPGSYVLVIRSGSQEWRTPARQVVAGRQRFDFDVP